MKDLPLISALTLLPLLGGLVVFAVGNAGRRLARSLSLAFSLAVLGLTLLIWSQFNSTSGAMQFVEKHAWIGALGIHYHVGLDGVSLVLLLLTAIVVPMSLLASWSTEQNAPVYFGLVLLLESGLIGTFTALNFFHWFLFWELSLIPAFFLIRLWGGARRAEAATQFFIYTMVGSVALLLAFLAIYTCTRQSDFIALAEMGRQGLIIPALSKTLGWYDLTTRWLALVIFGGAFLGFAVKVPLFPFHSWLPLAYVEASPGTTMLLTGLMSKMGVYGFLRVLVPIFSQEMRWVVKPLLGLAVISIVFSASAALAQRNLRRMLAYSSINHLGYCMLGIFAAMSAGSASSPLVEKAAALDGVLLQVFNHGLTAATLFWFVSLLEQRNGGVSDLSTFGGIRKVAPVLCGLMGIASFSSLGLPGLNGFPGEFLIFKGAFPLAPWATALSLPGLLLTAVFVLTILERVFFGPLDEKHAQLPDLTVKERFLVAPAIGLMFLLGVWPQALVGMFNSTVKQMVQHLRF
jgi:NADH-quinone oxidoreductase subunit M